MSEENKNVALFLSSRISVKFNDKGVGVSCCMFFDNLNLNFGNDNGFISGIMDKYDFVGGEELSLKALTRSLEYYTAANNPLKAVCLHIQTDSAYLHSRLSVIDTLRRNHFHSSEDKPISHADEWREISDILSGFEGVSVSLCYPSNSEKMDFVNDQVEMLLD